MTSRQALIGFTALIAIVAGTYLALDSGAVGDVHGERVTADPQAAERGTPLPTAASESAQLLPTRELAAPPADPLTPATALESASITGQIHGRLVKTDGEPIPDEPVDLLARRDP